MRIRPWEEYEREVLRRAEEVDERRREAVDVDFDASSEDDEIAVNRVRRPQC